MRAAIELFGSEWCAPCGKAKEIIGSTAPASEGVSFTYIDVGEDPAYAMKTLPVIFIGDEKLDGPTEAQIRASLDRLYAAVKPKFEPEPEVPDAAAPPVPPSEPDPNGITSEPNDPNGIIIGVVFAVLGFLGYRTLYDD